MADASVSEGDVESFKILEISAEGVEQHIHENDTVIIDVRKFSEVDEFGKIPTAHVLPVEDIESAMRLSGDEFYTNYGFVKPQPTGQPVIAYCRSGRRAVDAAKVLIKQFGFPSLLVYKGSWLDWAQRHPEDTINPPK